MLLTVPDVLDAGELAQVRSLLASARWTDGRTSAGAQAALAKNNSQLAHDEPAARELRSLVLRALDRSTLFFSAVLPKRVLPPAFNRYAGQANSYGAHVDNAVRTMPETGQRVRTDVSCTLFLSPPADYEGGELQIRSGAGVERVKLAAGALVCYPGTSVHEVTAVTRGERLACFFWIESMVRDPARRQLLFDMDCALTQLRSSHGESPQTVALVGTYHNLLRMWADT